MVNLEINPKAGAKVIAEIQSPASMTVGPIAPPDQQWVMLPTESKASNAVASEEKDAIVEEKAQKGKKFIQKRKRT